ncbi:PREDICTED: histamine H2 receptor-like [Priapulus caudatus]|uniref:Histamine H2 receptor-like n=1 Tax=Priapulus caudatus TaxID=37621 RepID=A0ABM1DYR9_PRICU|nr:PREDICTED: histamine H2 receptor-like [Priapulus caudatus]
MLKSKDKGFSFLSFRAAAHRRSEAHSKLKPYKRRVNTYHWLAQCIHYFIILLIMIVLYGRIFHVALRQQKLMAESERRASTLSLEAAHIQQAMRTVRVFLLVFGALIVCLTPFYVVYTYLAMHGLTSTDARYLTWTGFADILVFANSTVNPFIYAWKFKDFRLALRRMFRVRHKLNTAYRWHYNLALTHIGGATV